MGFTGGSEWLRPSRAEIEAQKLLNGWDLSFVAFLVPFTINGHFQFAFLSGNGKTS